jgi:hypothetical protein
VGIVLCDKAQAQAQAQADGTKKPVLTQLVSFQEQDVSFVCRAVLSYGAASYRQRLPSLQRKRNIYSPLPIHVRWYLSWTSTELFAKFCNVKNWSWQ